MITASAFHAIYFANDLEGTVKIVVNGEEDLLTLPAILLASPKSCVIYGQPNEGLVALLPTHELKTRILYLLKQFKPIDPPSNNTHNEKDR